MINPVMKNLNNKLSYHRRWPIVSVLWVWLLLLMLSGVSFAQTPPWKWGLDNTGCTVPEGLLGCVWFNYSAAWTQDAATKFDSWQSADLLDHGYCFEGTLASILNYYRWPDRSQIIGPYKGKFIEINHSWRYDVMRPPSGQCETDNVYTRTIPGCQSGYCTVANEIARLHFGVRVACNWDGYASITDAIQGLQHILRSRLGFVNAQLINSSTPGWSDIIRTEISDNSRPVIEGNTGHVWVLDAVRGDGGGGYEFHALDGSSGSCGNRHPAYWRAISSTNFFIINLDPTVAIVRNSTQTRSFIFGDNHVPKTSGTHRKTRFRIVSQNSVTGSLSATVNTNLYNHNSGQWEYNQTLLSESVPLSSTGAQTGYFDFSVPVDDSIKIDLSLQAGSTSGDASVRMVLEEPPPSRIIFKKSGITKMDLVQDGCGAIVGVVGPVNTTGALLFKNNSGTTAMTIDDNGNLGAAEFHHDNYLGSLDNSTFLDGGIGHYYHDKSNLHANADGNMVIARWTIRENAAPLYLLGIPSFFNSGAEMSIRWGTQFVTVNQVNLYWKRIADVTWSTIVSNHNAQGGLYIWSIPSDLANAQIKIKIENVEDPNMFNICPNTISIGEPTQIIEAPTSATWLQVGEATTIKWKFDPPGSSTYTVEESYDAGRTYTQIGDQSIHGESMEWVPSQPSAQVKIRVKDYVQFQRNAVSEMLTVH
jgi:hypothetical protein